MSCEPNLTLVSELESAWDCDFAFELPFSKIAAAVFSASSRILMSWTISSYSTSWAMRAFLDWLVVGESG